MIFEPKKNICILNVWDFDMLVHDELLLSNKIMKNGIIIINSASEFEYPNLDKKNLEKIDNLLEKKNNKLIIVYGSHGFWQSNYKNIQIIEYPIYFLRISKFPEKRIFTDEDTPFCTLINRPYEFRCKFIDKIHEKKLDGYFNFTWNTITPTFLGYQYPFEYFEEKVYKLDDRYENGNNWIHPPTQYFESLFDIVLESTVDCKFYTEKTARPIYYKKPFILVGSTNINKGLTDFGFELYDEIIDYSFDSENDLDIRIDMVVFELRKLKKINLKKIQKITQKKIEHNFQNLLKIQKEKYDTGNSFHGVFNKINFEHMRFKLENTNNFLELINSN